VRRYATLPNRLERGGGKARGVEAAPSHQPLAERADDYKSGYIGKTYVPFYAALVKAGHHSAFAYLTLSLDPGTSLADAHARASEIEERIRRERPEISDVIVHTEP